MNATVISSPGTDPGMPADERKIILVVDDIRENLEVIVGLLQPYYRIRAANSGQRAIKAALLAPVPDLILLDIMMPDMDGHAVLAELRANASTRDIPVIFVSAMDGDHDEELGLEKGAVDYITKPIRPAILKARVKNHLELKQSRDWLRDKNGYLKAEVDRRMRENDLIKDIALNALATLAEKRDNETGNHLYRTQSYISTLMRRLESHPRFAAELAPEQQKLITKAAPLHDIGKVGIPDAILLKPGRLTPEEFEIMKEHSRIGGEAIAEAIERVLSVKPEAERQIASESPLAFLEVARQIAIGHHEKWDGSGYPLGLIGDAIPLPARLMAVADVFDALISRRHYKEPFAFERAFNILSEGRGKHFDPDIVDAFFSNTDEMLAIAHRYADSEPA